MKKIFSGILRTVFGGGSQKTVTLETLPLTPDYSNGNYPANSSEDPYQKNESGNALPKSDPYRTGISESISYPQHPAGKTFISVKSEELVPIPNSVDDKIMKYLRANPFLTKYIALEELGIKRVDNAIYKMKKKGYKIKYKRYLHTLPDGTKTMTTKYSLKTQQ